MAEKCEHLWDDHQCDLELNHSDRHECSCGMRTDRAKHELAELTKKLVADIVGALAPDPRDRRIPIPQVDGSIAWHLVCWSDIFGRSVHYECDGLVTGSKCDRCERTNIL